MTEMYLEFKEFYWAHREVFRLAGAGLAFVLAQFVILLWTLRRLRELSSIRERMSRLADGLALLTDTTESGFEALAARLQQMSRQSEPARPAARRSVAKRVKSAAKKGQRIARIAADESLSETEVRLHLALADERRRDDEPATLAS